MGVKHNLSHEGKKTDWECLRTYLVLANFTNIRLYSLILFKIGQQ
jgi:hypothetical protein